MSAGGVLAAGLGLSLFGAHQQGRSEKDAARYNYEVAKEDIKLIQAEADQKQRIQREAGGRQLGSIQAAAAASGVSASSGSALDALAAQAAANARNEFLIGFESAIAQERTLQQAKMGQTAASNRATGYMLSAVGGGLQTGATFLAAGG